jgi:hypothetical protein
MKNKFIISCLVACCLSVSGYSQSRIHNLYGISWEIGFPVENNDFLSKTSYSGGKIEFRHFIKENLSVGGFFSWNSYYEYFPKATYTNNEGTQAVTTDMYRYIYTFPFGINGHYYFKAGKLIKPFAGLALGTQYSDQRLFYNIYESRDENWGFFVRPEIGAIIKLEENGHFGFLLGATYGYGTNKNDRLGIDHLGNVNVQIGVVFTN